MLGEVALEPAVMPQAPSGRPRTTTEAAQQFEALLIAQMLKSARGDEGWLDGEEDAGNATAGELAEEQLALALAQRGGLGLSRTIVQSLSQDPPKTSS